MFHEFSDVSKTSKQFGRILLISAVLLLFWIIIINLIKTEKIVINKIKIALFGLCIFVLTICMFYGLIYNVFLKYKNNEYFVTNKRIALYNSKIGLKIENIFDIDSIGLQEKK